MVTATDEHEALERAFEAGATDYLTKPVHKVQLRARVRSALKLKQEMDKRQLRERELEKLTKQLTELSNKDGLTRVPNRRYFNDQYLKEYRRALRDGSHLCLMMIDIDFFKAYNDAYGHLAGDTCLRQVAQTVSSVVNRPGDLVARFGGEEFVVLLPGTDRDGALVIAQAIQRAIQKLSIEHRSSSISKRLTLSIGIASEVPATSKVGPEKLLAEADKALYKSKSLGRNAISFADAPDASSDSS